MPSRVNGVALATMATGSVLLYAGIKGISVPAALQSIVRGKSPTGLPQTAPIDTPVDQSGAPGNAGLVGAPDSPVPATPGGGTNAQNKALMRLMAGGYGWATGAQWTALDNVVMAESGYNNEIYNGGQVGGPYQPNKAYGIAQALGHGADGAPYPSGNAGNPPGAGGTSSATAQIAWMLAYIKSKYGTPEAAWATEQSQHSY